MRTKGIWEDRSSYSQFLILVGIALVSCGVLLIGGIMALKPVFGIGVAEFANIQGQYDNPLFISALKFLQVIQAISLFLIPSFVFAYFVSAKPLSYLGLNKKTSYLYLLGGAGALLLALPLINWLGYLNQHITLPPSMAGLETWMKQKEEETGTLMKAFLVMGSLKELLLNIFMIAFLAALGEELLFRGVIQRIFINWIKNPHVAIFLTAVIFSAVHMQFYGFIPRCLMGVFLGYLYYWSGSLWVSVAAHFVNNAAAVFFEYYNQKTTELIPADALGTRPQDTAALIASIIIFCAATYILYKNRKGSKADLA